MTNNWVSAGYHANNKDWEIDMGPMVPKTYQEMLQEYLVEFFEDIKASQWYFNHMYPDH